MTRKIITSETQIIQGYLAPLAAGFAGAHGLSDDAASLTPPPGMDLVATMDAIAAGVHFFPDDVPADIGWKALAVNVSDLVAKGAEPYAYLMSLAFPEAPTADWLEGFTQGLLEAQTAFGLSLIGGDTDRRPGPLSITITALGLVPNGRMVRRGTAQAGDRILVSGTLGDSALGLRSRSADFAWTMTQERRDHLVARYRRPEPRLALAPLLRQFAVAGMDISDGLIKDLTRMTVASGVSARVHADTLPLSPAALCCLVQDPRVLDLIASGGDDYEVLAAVRPQTSAQLIAAAALAGVRLTDIGAFDAGCGVELVDAGGRLVVMLRPGYDHF